MQIVTAEDMQQVDQYAIETLGIPGSVLMENAGRAVAHEILPTITLKDRIVVLIGTGNNGGDGFVIARILAEAGYHVEAWLIPPLEKIKGDAERHLQIYQSSGWCLHEYEKHPEDLSEVMSTATILIDTLLGTGIKGPPRSPYREVIQQINQTKAAVIAVDVPSGIPVNGGAVEGEPVKADQTVVLQALKLSAFSDPAAWYYGDWTLVDIGIPQKALQNIPSHCSLWHTSSLQESWPSRSMFSHKGTFGKAAVFAGSREMPGAPVMTARASMRGGVGLLTLAIPQDIQSFLPSPVPEAMVYPCVSKAGVFAGELPEALPFDGIAVGPGIGRDSGAEQVVSTLLQTFEELLVIDADGLYHASHHLETLKQRTAVTILTPHMGEMARLLGTSVADVRNRRFEVSETFAREYGVYLVLKGPHTIVTTPEGAQFVNATGHTGLAKGGSGDVLTGFILAAVLQHEHIQAGISNAVFLHGKAADYLLHEKNAATMLATDLIEAFPRVCHALLDNEA